MYLDYYGFHKHPFNLTADPGFLFPSSQHREALSFMFYGIRERKGFLAITGEVGTGKTTLCRALLSMIEEKIQTAFILNSNLTEFQLLQLIIEDFGITPSGRSKVTLMNALNKFLLEQRRLENNAVLIIDEAQNLSSGQLEQVRMLSNLETAEDKLLQIILVGQPQLKKKLDSPELLQLRQRVAIRFHLKPLSRDEVKRYIAHRLKVAGGKGVCFTVRAIDYIYDYSRGVPRLVNTVCDRALLAGFAREEYEIGPRIIREAVRELEGKPALVS